MIRTAKQKHEAAVRIAVRVLAELQGCFEDTDNGSAISLNETDDTNYEDNAKDFLRGVTLAAGMLVEKLTGNEIGDIFDLTLCLGRIAVEYSEAESNEPEHPGN